MENYMDLCIAEAGYSYLQKVQLKSSFLWCMAKFFRISAILYNYKNRIMSGAL